MNRRTGGTEVTTASGSEGARRIADAAGVRLLSDAVLRVRGDDAASWLNGQITNQILLSKPGDAVYALVLDGRGKILSDVWVLRRDHDLLLLVPAEARDVLVEHFEKYIVMEDVELHREEHALVSVQGPRAAEIVAHAGLTGFPCDRLGLGGVDVLGEPGERGELLERLAGAAEALGGGRVDEDGWELARLRQARPRWSVDFGHAHYPQEAGLSRLAVSFVKGCYLGQEVVCTLENRGQLSRRMVVLTGAADAAAPGEELSLDGKVVGQLTSRVEDPAGRLRGLGYAKRVAAQPGVVLTGPRGALTVEAIVGEADPTGGS
jgi:folate-binding protein YgfZ